MDRRAFLERAGAVTAAAALPAWLSELAAASPTDRRLRELARSIEGAVIAPGDRAYNQARLSFNTRFDRVHPLAIVLCETVADVEKTVRWARKYGIRMAPRSGGHSYGGYSTTSGVVVDVGRLNGIRIDPARRRVEAGSGARLIDVYAALWRHGLTLPAGSCPTVGIAGLTLGGGAGYSARKLGLTCDNLRALRVVTATGDALECDARQHADLFWASRGGGGGNFGIATGFTFRVHPVKNVSIFRVEWPWAQAVEAVRAWQRWAPHVPDALFSVCDLLATGTGGRAHVVSAGQYFGAESELASLIRPLVDTGTPIRVRTRTMSYIDAVLEWAGCNGTVEQCHPEPRGTLGRDTFVGKSDYVNRPLSRTGVETLVRWIEARQSDPELARGAALLDAYGGAVNRVPKDATAFVHRDALFSIQYVASWAPTDPTRVAAANLRWARGLYAAMRPYVSGFAYQNYIDPDLASWKHAYYGSNYRRLVAVKRRYDPERVFRFPQGISA